MSEPRETPVTFGQELLEGLAEYRDELAEIRLENHGLYASHNMPCAVCLEQKAVFDCQAIEFHPCHECQSAGRYLGDRADDASGLFGATMFVVGVVVGLMIAGLIGA